MSVVFLRRRGLGNGSTKGIISFMKSPALIVRNDIVSTFGEATLCIRWGCTSSVSVKNVLNTAKAIHGVNNKLEFRHLLNEHSLCPKTWFEGDIDNIIYPVIIRPEHHAQGRNLWIANDREELLSIIKKHRNSKIGHMRLYFNEIIDKVAEYRIFVGSGRAVWVAKKTPGNPKDIAWNVAKGGRFDNVRWSQWPLKAIRIAIEAFNLTELDFGGVDIMVDAHNNCYVLEINSAPSQTSPYRQSCVAKYIDYIVKNGKDRLSLIGDKGGFSKFGHPCLSDKVKNPTVKSSKLKA